VYTRKLDERCSHTDNITASITGPLNMTQNC